MTGSSRVFKFLKLSLVSGEDLFPVLEDSFKLNVEKAELTWALRSSASSTIL